MDDKRITIQYTIWHTLSTLINMFKFVKFNKDLYQLDKIKFNIIILCGILSFSCAQPSEKNESQGLKDKDSRKHNTLLNNEVFKNTKARDLYLEGLKFLRKGDLSNARLSFLNANKIEPDNASILSELGIVEMRMFNYESSEQYFKKGLRVDSNQTIYLNMGLLYYFEGKYTKAIEISKLMNCKKANSKLLRSYYNNLFMAYARLNNCDSARHYYHLATDGYKYDNIREHIDKFKEHFLNDTFHQKD